MSDEEQRPGRAYARRVRRRAVADAAEQERLQALRARLNDVYADDLSDSSVEGLGGGGDADDEGSSDSSIADGAGGAANNPGDQPEERSDEDGGLDVEAGDRREEGSESDDDNARVSDAHSISDVDGESDGAASGGSDGNGQINLENEADREAYLLASLRKWAVSPGVLSLSKVDELLAILNPLHENVPLSHKTLLKCETDLNIQILPSGAEFWYRGIKKNLDCFDLGPYLQKFEQICLDINMDGLPLFKSSKMKFFPILGVLVGTENEPFVIALHFGVGEPSSGEDFLPDYVREVAYLEEYGYEYQGTVFPFKIRYYIMDALARQLVKCCKSHSGFSGCEKCCVVGVTVDNRRTFLQLDQPKRTDETFRNQDDPAHHTGVSLLVNTNVGFVSQFRLDPLHLLYQGVMKKILDNWLNIVGPWKLHVQIIQLISQLLVFIADTCPSDFNRKPRSLSAFGLYKATELRRILLYDGMLVFKDLVDNNIYDHFMLFQCAVYILSRPDLLETKIDDAGEFLKAFVQHSAVIYGERFVIYNVHCLVHLREECDIAGVLEDFSAFKFENALKSLKDSLKTGFKPLQQVKRRAEEQAQTLEKKTIKFSNDYNEPVVSIKNEVANEIVAGTYYKKISFGSLSLQVGKRNSCFQTKTGDIVVLKNVVFRNNRVCLVGCKFLEREDYFQYPLASSELDIFRVWSLEETRRIYHCRQLKFKCWMIPDGLKFLIVPLFVICEFIPTDSNKPTFLEVGLTKWVVGPSEHHEGRHEIRWPKKENTVPTCIQKKLPPQADWKTESVVIMRMCETWQKANKMRNHLCVDSNYESEKEFGRGKRRRTPNSRFLHSESDEQEMLKQTTIKIAPPPLIVRKSKDHCSVKSGSQKAAAIARSNRQNESTKERLQKLVSKIDNAKVMVAEKMQAPAASVIVGKSSLPLSGSSTPPRKVPADGGRLLNRRETFRVDESEDSNIPPTSSEGPVVPERESVPSIFENSTPSPCSKTKERPSSSSKRMMSVSENATRISLSSMGNSIYKKTSLPHTSDNFTPSSVSKIPQERLSTRTVLTAVRVNTNRMSSSSRRNSDGCSKPTSLLSSIGLSALPKTVDRRPLFNARSRLSNVSEDIDKRSSSLNQMRSNSTQQSGTVVTESHTTLQLVSPPSEQDLDISDGSDPQDTRDLSEVTKQVMNADFEGESPRSGDRIQDELAGEDNEQHHGTLTEPFLSESDGSSHFDEGSQDEVSQILGSDSDSDSDIGVASSITGRLSKLEDKQQRTFVLCKEISGKLDEVLMNQGKLNRTLLPHEKKINKPTNMPNIPLSSIQEFRDFEEFLSNNENFSAMVFYISVYLCKDEEKSARKLLAKLLTNQLASQFTYHGSTGKRSFKDTNLGEVFESALLTYFKTDLSDARDAAGKWFRNAPWRKPSDGEGKRKRASNKAHSQSSVQSKRFRKSRK